MYLLYMKSIFVNMYMNRHIDINKNRCKYTSFMSDNKLSKL